MNTDRNGVKILTPKRESTPATDPRFCDPRTLERGPIGYRVRSRMNRREAMELARYFRACLFRGGWISKIYPAKTSNSIYIVSRRRGLIVNTRISDHTQPASVKQCPTVTSKKTARARAQWIKERYK